MKANRLSDLRNLGPASHTPCKHARDGKPLLLTGLEARGVRI